MKPARPIMTIDKKKKGNNNHISRRKTQSAREKRKKKETGTGWNRFHFCWKKSFLDEESCFAFAVDFAKHPLSQCFEISCLVNIWNCLHQKWGNHTYVCIRKNLKNTEKKKESLSTSLERLFLMLEPKLCQTLGSSDKVCWSYCWYFTEVIDLWLCGLFKVKTHFGM